MKQTRLLMGMPVTVEAVRGNEAIIEAVFELFEQVDMRYSTYKPDSEISRINAGLPRSDWSEEMKQVLELCERTKQETDGYFDIKRDGKRDPSGLVKGWAIQRAAELVRQAGYQNFYLEAGGDIQTGGTNAEGTPWRIGVRSPFNRDEIVKVLHISDEGVATSGTAIRGQHIYNPHTPDAAIEEVSSLTVVGPNIYEADRFATAAFAMGPKGIEFIESRPELEGYMITPDHKAVMTSGFEKWGVH